VTLEILVAAACTVVGAPVLYVTLKACSMALRGEPIGEPKLQRYCMKCRWFQENQPLIAKNDPTKKFRGDWCELLRMDDPVQKKNLSHDCKHWEKK
jgi:hypothetical protein